MPKKPARLRALNINALAHMIVLLTEGTRTSYEIAAETGLNVNTVYRWCRALYTKKALHIAGYEVDGRGAYTTRIYKLAPGKDAVSNPRDRAEKSRMERQRKRDITTAHALAGNQPGASP